LKIKSPFELSEYGVDGNRNFGLPKIIININMLSGFTEFGSNNEIVIHPNTNLEVVYIKIEIPQDLEFLNDIEINYKICSEDFSLIEAELLIDYNSILEHVKSLNKWALRFEIVLWGAGEPFENCPN